MEKIAALAIPALAAVLFVRCMLLPMKWIFKVGAHALCGLLCLWALNTASGLTGLYLPINAVTVLIAGVFGVPGMTLIALLEIF